MLVAYSFLCYSDVRMTPFYEMMFQITNKSVSAVYSHGRLTGNGE
ncbi:hypothetical protein ROSINTL182_08695 [Roseburia intestinalis L1-82]|uniref:Uncharacterized protein n=1 Tax=Roseburia intestinalis L1-82 TaxID=536231 RepID=C7GFI8_9FIRM|nr:hypothetical protein ROSINTL182_08695 [Roseburia intestinalis L1-82]